MSDAAGEEQKGVRVTLCETAGRSEGGDDLIAEEDDDRRVRRSGVIEGEPGGDVVEVAAEVGAAWGGAHQLRISGAVISRWE